MRDVYKKLTNSKTFIASITAIIIVTFLLIVKDRSARAVLSFNNEHTPILAQDTQKAKLKNKNRAKKVRAENPGVFLKALSEIKTAPDGTYYKPNYKQTELNMAKARLSKLESSSSSTTDLGRVASSAVTWIERGPGNVSGRARTVVMDPADANHRSGFVATVGGGIWKFAEDGAVWENKTPDLTTLSTTTLAMCTGNPDVMYAGTGMGYGRVVDLAGSGIWKTTDRGETWAQLASTANNELLPAINRIVVDPNNEHHVVVCSNGDYTSFGPNGGSRESGIFLSLDGGSSWDQTFYPDAVFGNTTDNRVQQIIANPENFNTLYASVNEVGVIKSVDGGETWTISADNFARAQDIGYGEGTYEGISTRTELAISRTDTARLYAAVERRFGVAKLFMSKDAGASWVEVVDVGSNPNWFNGGGESGATGAYTAGWFDNTIAVHPFDEDIVFVGGVELYRLTVNPLTNTRSSTLIASTGVVHADHHWLEMVPTGSSTFRIFNANDGGIAISDNAGISWRQVTGMGTTQFYGADKKPGESAYIGGMQDNGTWRSNADPDKNSFWNRAVYGDGVEVAWNYADPNLLLAGSQNGNLSRSVDGGQNWYAIPDARAGSSPFISKIASSKLDPDLVFTVGMNGVKRSDDFGATWTLSAVAGNWIGWRAFDNVEISVADPQVVWISSRMNYESWIGKKGGIHVSTDGGLTFTEISQNLPANLLEASGIGTHPSDPNTAYLLFSAANGPKIMRTEDLGQTWEDISGFTPAGPVSSNGFPNVAVYSLMVMPDNESTLWAGTEIGLFVSTDAGANWQIADNGLPNVGIFQMQVVDGEIVTATYGRGVWTAMDQIGSYEKPSITLSPRLTNFFQTPAGSMVLDVSLRSPYDSTKIFQNNKLLLKLQATTSALDTSLTLPIVEDGTVLVQIVSYKNGRGYKSAQKSTTIFFAEARKSYQSNFNSIASLGDFFGNGFSIRLNNGFSAPAIHSAHPYPESEDLIYQLKVPIIVQTENAILSYKDVALIEEGIAARYTDPNFWDYVIVEATKDGVSWLPLTNGYDSRLYSVWSSAYEQGLNGNDSNTPGTESMYFKHSLNLLSKFSAGDTIFVRFRLFSDPLAVAWGWAIDSLSIQLAPTARADEPELPMRIALHQNYPNPFNPMTTITYDLPEAAELSMKIYDMTGREVIRIVEGRQKAGYHELQWDGRDDMGRVMSTGIYFCRLQTTDYIKTIKMHYLK
ncbi:MAG: T9SS type A sorting domain-containing protein [Candidatus Marinimicrobia bacterium]|nr:T9SS type A sorting domain-containing protein [Candidatus Neomarinimicrobiota bacterium]